MLSNEQDVVEMLIGDGTPFDEIEAYLDKLALGSEEHSALWLLAWVQTTNPATHRRAITETVVTSGSGGNDPPRRPTPPRERSWR
ncbi:MAG: hypothetical protein M3065_06755 [Actinomycetota bacterium]|nr:hypothetical protein [Actinomycetota bacterium]